MRSTNAFVTIQEASEHAGVSVDQIRRWAAIDGVRIQGRGARELVLLDQVMALAAADRRRTSRSRSALVARLADARIQNPSVSGLQQAARDQQALGS